MKKIGLIFTCALLIISMASLAACSCNFSINTTPTDAPKTEAVTEMKTPTVDDYVVPNYSNGDTDKLPIINIDSEDAKEINNELKSLWESKKDYGPYFTYDAYLSNNLVSLVVHSTVDGGNSEDYVYNIDTVAGVKLDNDAMAERHDTTFDKLMPVIKSTLETKYNEEYAQLIKNNDKDQQEATQKTLSDDNIKTAQLYEADGKLQVSIGIYTTVGGGQSTMTFSLDI